MRAIPRNRKRPLSRNEWHSADARKRYRILRKNKAFGMMRKFDVVVIGTGSAASAVASRCRSAGWQVAVIDSRPFGGTCALRGCNPKKVLVGAAEALDRVRNSKGKRNPPAKITINTTE